MTGSGSPKFFQHHQATGLGNLIVYDADMNERDLAAGYEDVARRLAQTYQGKAWDDLMLMPLLFLWRQAIELSLKATIRDLCALRRNLGHVHPELAAPAVDERLRNPKKVGHDLHKLTTELSEHLQAIGAEPEPFDVLDTLSQLAELDNRGTGFRYIGVLKSQSAQLNIEALTASLAHANLMLTVTIDAVTNGQGV